MTSERADEARVTNLLRRWRSLTVWPGGCDQATSVVPVDLERLLVRRRRPFFVSATRLRFTAHTRFSIPTSIQCYLYQSRA